MKWVFFQKLPNGLDVLLQAAGRAGRGQDEATYIAIFKGTPSGGSKKRSYDAINFIATTACLREALNDKFEGKCLP